MIFCVHNLVVNAITTVQCNELHVAGIVSMLNSARDACVDYHYCLSQDYKFSKYHELDLTKQSDIEFEQNYINQGLNDEY